MAVRSTALGLSACLAAWLSNSVLVWAEEAPSTPPPSSPAPAAANANPATASPTAPEAAAPQSPTRYELRYHFEPGQVIRYVTSDESVVDVEQGGTATTVKYSTKSWKHYRVKSVAADGTAHVEVVIDRVVMRAEGQGRVTEFDSQEPGAPPAEFAHLLEVIGRAAVALHVTPDGRMEGAEFLLGSGSKPLDVQDRDSQVLTMLPAAPVAIGDTWRERFNVPVKLDGKLAREVKLQRTYSLTSVQDGIATVDLETFILTPVSDPELESQLIQRTPSGVLTIDLERGVVLSKQTTVHNQVVGFSGPGSKLKLARTYAERLGDDAASLSLGAVPAAR